MPEIQKWECDYSGTTNLSNGACDIPFFRDLSNYSNSSNFKLFKLFKLFKPELLPSKPNEMVTLNGWCIGLWINILTLKKICQNRINLLTNIYYIKLYLIVKSLKFKNY
jgi:hypothetical protein